MKMPSISTRWQLWAGAVFVLGLASGVAITEWLAHRPAERAAPADNNKAQPSAGRVSERVTMDAAAQRNVGLGFETAQVRNVERTIQATGVVAPNESRLAHVRALARGRIEKVFVRLGDRVRAGQVLMIYDNAELGEAIGQYLAAFAALEKAQAEAGVSQRSVERAKSLLDAGALASSEFDRRNTEYRNALATIESQKAEMAKTHEKLHRFGLNEREVLALNSREGEGSHREASHTSVKAPFDGAIIQYNAVEGETVAPDEVIFAVADLSTAWVIADVYEKDIPAVRQGQQAKISIESYPGVVFLGRITYVSDFLDPKTRTAKVRCEVPNRDGSLKLDMFANVQLPTSSGGRVLMVPSAAIQQVNDRPVAFVKLSETEFEMRPLQLGAPSDGWVEVASGIREGETVATHGSFFLKSTHLRSEIGGEE